MRATLALSALLHGALALGLWYAVRAWRPVEEASRPAVEWSAAAEAEVETSLLEARLDEEEPISEGLEFGEEPGPEGEPASSPAVLARASDRHPVSRPIRRNTSAFLARVLPAIPREMAAGGEPRDAAAPNPPRLDPASGIQAADLDRPLAGDEGSASLSLGAASRPPRAVETGNQPPSYPRSACRRGWEGTVILLVRISTEGTVESLEVTSSSGHAVLDEAATGSVREWRFEPALEDGRPVPGVLEIPVVFRLE